MPHYTGPLLTRTMGDALREARSRGASTWSGSFDLERTHAQVRIGTDAWHLETQSYPYPSQLKERTLYYWDGEDFAAISRFSGSLIKLIPTPWGAPTFEIDGIKMLPSMRVSPFEDARRKVALVMPQGKMVLDTCGGLGYFAACCLEAGAIHIRSFEKNPDVLWLRTLNPWSPDTEAAHVSKHLQLVRGDIAEAIKDFPDASFGAILHDPPRFSIAGELYARRFYDQLARVLRRGGHLFHYTGTPNQLSHGSDVPREVARRLEKAGFRSTLTLDGVLAQRR
ncbi:MAG TPA: class I SAM-dependent methyltransferase [Xylella taiwanensis]